MVTRCGQYLAVSVGKNSIAIADIWGDVHVYSKGGDFVFGLSIKLGNTKIAYSSGRFGIVNWDSYAYIVGENGDWVKRVYVGGDYDNGITMTPDGFVACGERCAFFDFNGNKLWDVDVERVVNGPSYYKGYWYVADSGEGKLLIIKDGKVVNEISYGEKAYDTAVCDNYLAVSTYSSLYLYDLSNPEKPKELWNVEGFDGAIKVAFSPSCNYIAVADVFNEKVMMYSINKRKKIEIELYCWVCDKGNTKFRPNDLAWVSRDTILVATEAGVFPVYLV